MSDADIAAVLFDNSANEPAAEDTGLTVDQLANYFDHPSSRPASDPPSTAEAIDGGDAVARPAAVVDASASVHTPEEAATALYGEQQPAVDIEVPEAIKELRKGDSPLYDGREAYSTAITIDDFAPTSDEEGDAPDIPEHVKAAAVQEYRAMFNDLRLAPVDAREVVSLARQLGREPPTAEAEAEWSREAAQQLVDTNGGSVEEANAALSLAKALVQRDPRLKTILEVTRLGSHPRVVKLLVERARAERVAGRL